MGICPPEKSEVRGKGGSDENLLRKGGHILLGVESFGEN